MLDRQFPDEASTVVFSLKRGINICTTSRIGGLATGLIVYCLHLWVAALEAD